MINIADGTSSSATNRVVENNLIVQRDDPSADGYYGDLFVNPLDPAPTLDDPRTIPGGLMKQLGVGAAMPRGSR